MADRPFRFGVVAGYAPDVQTLSGIARRAEQLGFDTLMTPDPVTEYDPLAVLSAVAAVTTDLRFGTFVLAEPLRDGHALIWQAQSLASFSKGRFILGLGLGHPGNERRAAQLERPIGTPGQRLARLTETIAALKQLPDRPPLLLPTGSGPKLLNLASREADIVTLTWRPPTTEVEADEIVARFRQAAGDRLADIEVNVNLVAAGNTPAAQAQQSIGMSVADLMKAGAVTVLPGSPGEMADTVRRWRERWGVTYVSVSANYMEQFAPVIEKLSGD